MKKTKHNLSFIDIPVRIIKSKFFLFNFLSLMGILTIIFLIFAFSLFSQSRTTIKNEFTSASEYALETTVSEVDRHVKDVRYIIATLDTNNIIRSFFSSKNPEYIYGDYQMKIQEILKAYVNGFPSIDSVYLYSMINKTIITPTLQSKSAFFDDSDWIENIENAEDGFSIFFRKKNGLYPFFLTVAKKLTIDGHQAAVIVNVNLHNFSALQKITNNPYQEIFLISDEGDIVFRNGQEDSFESIDLVPELVNYQPKLNTYSDLIENGSPYVFLQKKSETNPWTFVMITHLQEYTEKVSSSRALFFTVAFCLFLAVFLIVFFLCLRIAAPTFELIQLLDNSEQPIEDDLYSSEEIEYIAKRITDYIQQNKTLSDELNNRLNTLNQTKLLALQSQINPHFLFNTLNMIHIQECETLGYDHKIPEITLKLSRLLHYAIESTDLSPLESELEYTKMYTDILQNRFDGKPQVIYAIDQSVVQTKVPKLFIQPIVENAVYHGLSESIDENSKLIIKVKRIDDNCILEVRDNGTGIPPDTLQRLRDSLSDSASIKNSIGIKNVYTRMALLYGKSFDLQIESILGEGTTFRFSFPLQI